MSDILGRDSGDRWPACVVLNRVQTHLSRVVALCYTAECAAARRCVRIRYQNVNISVHVGVSLVPDMFDAESEWLMFLSSVGDVGDSVHVYNHALMSNAHFDWFDTVWEVLERQSQQCRGRTLTLQDGTRTPTLSFLSRGRSFRGYGSTRRRTTADGQG